MIRMFTLLLLIFSSGSYAQVACDNVVKGYEDRSIMYVLCQKMPTLTEESASKLIQKIMMQYQGPPDEVIVYFIQSKSNLGKFPIPDNDLLANYYTHTNELVVLSNVEGKVTYKISWPLTSERI